MDADLGRIEQQKHDRHHLELDHGGEEVRCPECGSEEVSDRQGHIRPEGDDSPPWLMVCEDCHHEWEDES